MYDSCHFVDVERFAGLGHWRSRLGMQGNRWSKDVNHANWLKLSCHIDYSDSCMPRRNGRTMYM